MNQWRKRPVTVEARQWDGTVAEATSLINWILASDGTARYHDEPPAISIDVLGGRADAVPGDWIVRGVASEFYPCKSGIFDQTYEPAGTPSTVTVATAGGERSYRATAVEFGDDGELYVGDDGEKGCIADVRAIYAPGHWRHAGLDASQGPDHAARADAAERVIREVNAAASDIDFTVEERLASVVAILGRRKGNPREASE